MLSQDYFQGMLYVYEVYRARSFSRAAANLYISQPSLSANIKRIEQRIGYPLFDRSTKPLELTECGQQYMKAVEQILTTQTEFELYLNDLVGLKRGSLVFGGSNFFSSWVLPPLIADFSRRFPELDISLVEAKSVELVRQLQDAQIDFVLDNKDLDLSVFERHHVGKEELLLTVPKHYELNEELQDLQIPLEKIIDGSFRQPDVPTVPLDRFADHPFLLLRSSNDTGKRARKICQDYGFKPNAVFELDQQLTAYNIATTGIGIAFTGELVLSRVPATSNVVYYKLAGPHTTRDLYFYWKRGRYMSQAMRVFLESVVMNTHL